MEAISVKRLIPAAMVGFFLVMSIFLAFSFAEDGESEFKISSQLRLGLSSADSQSIAKKAVGFVGGLVAGGFSHEAGHQIMAWVEGADMSWRYDGSWTTNAEGGKLNRIVLSGWGAEVLITEALLTTDKIPKDSPFFLGTLTYYILHPFAYVLLQELKEDGYGDFKTLKKEGMDIRWLEIGLVAHSILSTYRVYKNPKFIPFVKATADEFVVGIGWRW